MKGAEVRERILEDHAELRRMLADLERLTDQFGARGPALAGEFEERGLAIYAKLIAHLDLEDSMVVPALRAAGAAGRRRAEQLVEEHREQRELLAFLIERLSLQSRPTILVASELRTFIECVHEDMEDEEANLLTREILGDLGRENRGESAAPH